MPAITSGPELVKKLRDSGTGHSKLRIAREELDRVYAAHGRVATADEVIAALTEGGVGELTLDKAHQLAATGEYKGPPQKSFDSAEDRYAEIEAKQKAEAEAAAAAKAPTPAKK